MSASQPYSLNLHQIKDKKHPYLVPEKWIILVEFLLILLMEENCQNSSNQQYPPHFYPDECLDGTVVNRTCLHGTVVNRTWLDGTVVNRTYLDGTVVNRTCFDGTVVNWTYLDGTIVNRTCSFFNMKSPRQFLSKCRRV